MNEKDFENALKRAFQKCDEKGVNEVLEKIYKEYYKLVCFCISKNVQGDALIEDLAQDTFIRFFENARTVRGSVKYYLVKVANNLSIDYIRRIDKESRAISVWMENNGNEKEERISSAYWCLIDDLRKVLTEREVAIIVSHSIEGRSFKEMEKEFGAKAKALNKTYERSLKKFKSSGRSVFYGE